VVDGTLPREKGERLSAMLQEQIFPVNPVKKRRGRDLLFEAVADATMPAWRRGLAKQHIGMLRAAVRDLRAMGVSPDEVPRLVAAYRRDMPGCCLTPTALAKHAPRLRELPRERRPYDVERCRDCWRRVEECVCDTA
jgi:hypothetical protein